MGDVNQIKYIKQFIPLVSGPVLEVGSKDYGNTSTLRTYYSNNEYIGVDMEAGKNVDQVIDFTQGIGDLSEKYFEFCICCSVLEHVEKPWVMAENLTRLIKPKGYVYMSVPWVWRYHAYPDDYFRFSWRGIISLFPEFDWQKICYSTLVPGEFIEVNDKCNDSDNKMALVTDTPMGLRKYLPYMMVNMLGIKK